MRSLLKKFIVVFSCSCFLLMVSIQPARAVTLNTIKTASGVAVAPGGLPQLALDVAVGVSRLSGWPALLITAGMYGLKFVKDSQNAAQVLGAAQKPIINGELWSAPSTASPSGGSYRSSTYSNQCQGFSTELQACECAAQTAFLWFYDAGTAYVSNGACSAYRVGVLYTNFDYIFMETAPSCPSGYTISGSTCNLTDESKVPYPADGLKQMRPDGSGGFIPDPRDTADPSNNFDPAADLNFVSQDSFGNTTAQTVTSTPLGGVKIDQYLDNPSSVTPTMLHQSASFASDGTLQSSTIEQVPGSIAQNMPSIQSGQTFPNSLPVSNFPTDYSREATLQKLVDIADGRGFDTVPDFAKTLSDSKISAVGQKEQTDSLLQGVRDGYTNDKGLWPSWFWTPPSVGCTNPTGVVHGQQWTLDICPTAEKIKDAIGWLLALFAAYDIFGLMFRRPDNA